MLQDAMTRPRNEDCSKMSLEELKRMAQDLATSVPQGPFRRGMIQDLGEVGRVSFWACGECVRGTRATMPWIKREE